MRVTRIPYLRFNIGPNSDNELDRISQIEIKNIAICQTCIFSNRPHLLDRAYALDHCVPRMNRAERGSRGIEKALTQSCHVGWIAGPTDYAAVIQHIDGYNALRAWHRRHWSNRTLELISRNIKAVREHFKLGQYGRRY